MWTSCRAPALVAYLLLAGASALFASRTLAQDDELKALSSIASAETRAQVVQLLEQGDTELEFGLLNVALFYYDQAWQLDQADPAVEERLERVADLMIDNAPRADDEDGLEVYLRDIDNMMAREALQGYDKLIEQRMAAERMFAALITETD